MSEEEYLKSQEYEISELTCLFHDTYEDFAKEYGYETRNDTKVFDMESPNGKTMYKTVEKIMTPYLDEIERLNNKVEELQDLYTSERYVKEDYKSIIEIIKEYVKHKIVECYDEGSTIGEFYKICDIDNKIEELLDKENKE